MEIVYNRQGMDDVAQGRGFYYQYTH
jgi:hypothetical protein